MPNPECEKCNGDGHYLVPNYQHDVMERIECLDCLAEDHFKWHLSEELTKVFKSGEVVLDGVPTKLKGIRKFSFLARGGISILAVGIQGLMAAAGPFL